MENYRYDNQYMTIFGVNRQGNAGGILYTGMYQLWLLFFREVV